ncbi:DUF2000 domain-containing protein [[Erwinia] mediterraneensis]|uniref:DUF2000 domain-containing protein n=1 Tax=[Erwinia] mediterraneensis TaxID=2161819 RepID=UPI0010316B66|nr:DUF2000 domain-containing protein [[Erwinia] mediterraneensis]
MQEQRCVMILNEDLAPGKAANAAAVIALTLGQRHPGFVGEPLYDAGQRDYPGLIPVGIPVLAASQAEFSALRDRCDGEAFDLILFPEEGQTTTDYQAFSAAMRQLPGEAWRLLGLAIVGEKKALRKLTARLRLYGQ